MLDVSRQRALLTFALLAPLVALKLQVNFGITSMGPDGSLYVEVARNVRDGLGLVSSSSLYHAGVDTFPHPTPLYPAWPLLLGLVARVVPLEVAAVWLPTALFFGALLLARRLALAAWPRPLFGDLWEVPDAGHLAVWLLGYNALFFESTSRPYTEGLAFFLLFLLAGRARAFFDTPAAWRAAELGAWAALLVLVRAQMFLLTLVLAGTFTWAVLFWRPVGKWAGYAAAAAAGWALVLAPHFAWLSTFYEPLRFDAILRFERFRVTDVLEPVQMLLPMAGPIDWALDRAQGFAVAYRNYGKYAYVRTFGVLHWAPVLAALALLPSARRTVAAAWTALRSPAAGFRLFFALLALGGFASIHTLHKGYGAEWNFATRHALTVLFLFAWGVVALGARAGAPRVAAVAIVSISAWLMGRNLEVVVNDVVDDEAGEPAYRAGLVWWLERERERDPSLVIASGHATKLSLALPGLPIHWVWPGTTFEDVDAMFAHLGADYVLVPLDASEHAFVADTRFAASFELVFSDVSGVAVYRRAPLPADTSGGLAQPGAFDDRAADPHPEGPLPPGP